MYQQNQIDQSDEVSHPFFKSQLFVVLWQTSFDDFGHFIFCFIFDVVNVMENISCVWKCPEENLAQKLLHRSKRIFLGEKKEKMRLRYPEETEKKSKCVSNHFFPKSKSNYKLFC